jgi:hypothetical protein
MRLEPCAPGGDALAEFRARLDALGLETLDDETQLRAIRLELDQLSQSLGAAREAADAASVEPQLRRLRKEEPSRRALRMRGLLAVYVDAIEALEQLNDPATATLILRLELRRARVAEELVTLEAQFPDLHSV